MAAEMSLALRERAQAELDKVGGDQQEIACFCWLSEMSFLLSAAVLGRAHPLGHGGPGEDASICRSGHRVSPVHGEERGHPKGHGGGGG